LKAGRLASATVAPTAGIDLGIIGLKSGDETAPVPPKLILLAGKFSPQASPIAAMSLWAAPIDASFVSTMLFAVYHANVPVARATTSNTTIAIVDIKSDFVFIFFSYKLEFFNFVLCDLFRGYIRWLAMYVTFTN
jgi:hypothetical protein